MKRLFLCVAVMMTVILMTLEARADTVTLQSGKILNGKIASFSETGFRFETDEGEFSVPYRMVAALEADPQTTESSPATLRAVMAQLAKTQSLQLQSAQRRSASEHSPEMASARSARKNSQVELYMTSWCGYCRKMMKFLRAQKIPFKSYDIEKDPKALERFQAMGGRGVPVIKVNGYVIRGYDPDAVIQAYTQ